MGSDDDRVLKAWDDMCVKVINAQEEVERLKAENAHLADLLRREREHQNEMVTAARQAIGILKGLAGLR